MDELENYNEAEVKEELLFSLQKRQEPTVVFISVDRQKKRNEIISFLKKELTEYHFFDADFSASQVTSLYKAFHDHLPAEILNSGPAAYIINVLGLENSLILTEDGKIKASELTAQLNYERELLFHQLPFIIIIWADKYFFKTLQKESPDFCHWVTYSFRFESANRQENEKSPELQSALSPSNQKPSGNLDRYYELEKKYDELNLDDPDKMRLIKEKINLLKLMGDELYAASRFEDSIAKYQPALALARNTKHDKIIIARLLLNEGKAYANSGKYADALHLLQQSAEVQEETTDQSLLSETYYYTGVLFNALTDYDKALEMLQKALSVNEHIQASFPADLIHREIGASHYYLKNWREAVNSMNLSLTLNPNDPYAHNNLALLLKNEFKEYDQAKMLYEKAIEINPGYANAHYNLAILLADEFKEFEQAKMHYEKAIEINPGDAEAHNNFAILLETEFKEFEQAKMHYEKAIDINPGSANAHNNLAILLQNEFKEFEQAKLHYEKAIEINPGYADAHYNLAILLAYELKEFEQAKLHYEKAIEINPGDANAHYNLAILLQNEFKDFEQAKMLYEKAIEINPGDAEAHYNLAILLFEKFKEYDLAKSHYDKAVLLNPQLRDFDFEQKLASHGGETNEQSQK